MIDRRHKDVYESRNDGQTFTAIGKDLGVSRQRATQIYERTVSEIERADDPLCILLDRYVKDRRMANQLLNTLHFYGVDNIDILAGLSDYDIHTMKRFGPYSEDIVFKMRDDALKGV